ncbi:bifunctional 5,6,7,8-tetrahydromethanopterin hydro-lyase/3-hexulose-6-phosphate synthase [Candidatus Bathyarchaeota archaeon]|nr:bifunctional 5,6,7,8-tetrahydromethanopterin hydro-lyase/3-hexulose-6-phosphate synthase [Candidatus Bathyarchaeota archaeon]
MVDFFIGEALLGKGSELAHIDLMMGDKGGPVGQAFATALVNLSKGHTPILGVIRPNLPPKPHMVIVPKVTVQSLSDANKIFGPAQAGCAKAVADAVEEGIIPIEKVDDWVIVCSVFIHPEASNTRKIYKNNYSATRLSIKRAMANYPPIDKIMYDKDRAKHPVSGIRMPRLWRPPYLQIALDSPSLSKAIRVIKECPRSDRIILEAGTPLIKKHGVDVIKELRKEAPDAFFIADLKTLDVGKVEVDMAFDADADAAVASGVAPNESIDKFLMEADRVGIYGIVDMLNVEDPIAKLKGLKQRPRVIILHRGIDTESTGAKTRWELIQEIKALYAGIKPPVLCAVAGGIRPKNCLEAIKNHADILIVGRYITQSQDVERAIRNFINLIPGPSDIDLFRYHTDDDDVVKP